MTARHHLMLRYGRLASLILLALWLSGLSVDAATRVVSGTVYRPDGSVYGGAQLTVRLVAPFSNANQTVVPQVWRAVANVAGFVTVSFLVPDIGAAEYGFALPNVTEVRVSLGAGALLTLETIFAGQYSDPSAETELTDLIAKVVPPLISTVGDPLFVNVTGDTMTGTLTERAGTIAALSQNYAGSATTGTFLNSTHPASISADATIIQAWGRNNASAFQSLFEVRNKQTLTGTSGVQAGRGAIRLYDRVNVAGRILELGFYEFGAGMFFANGGASPFEFWIESGIVSVKGGAVAGPSTYSNRLEVRTPSDAPGLNVEAGRFANTVDGLVGGHLTYQYTDVPNPSGYPLFMRTGDGSGLEILPLGVTRVGGRLLPAGSRAPVFTILSGDDGNAATLALGRYSIAGQDSVNLFHLRMQPNGRSAGLFYGVNTPEVTKALILTEDGRLGLGTDYADTIARLQVTGIEPSLPTVLVKGAPSQTADVQQWQTSAGSVIAGVTANTFRLGTTARLSFADGIDMTGTAGTMSIGGQSLPVGSREPQLRVLAGDDGFAANIVLGRWSISGDEDTKLWHLRMQPDGRSAGLFYGVGTPLVTKALIGTDDGRFGIGTDRVDTVARFQVTSIETAVPTFLLKPATSQTAPTLAITNAAGSSTLASVSAGGTMDAVAYSVGGVAGATGAGLAGAVVNGLQTSLTPDAEIGALSGLTSASDTMPYFTGSGTAALTPFTSFGRSLVDDADAAAGLTTLTAAGVNVANVFTQMQTAPGLSLTGGSATVTWGATASDPSWIRTSEELVALLGDGSAKTTVRALRFVADRSLQVSAGILTATAPLLDGAQTWNNGAVAFTGATLRFTETAAGASRYFQILGGAAGTTDEFYVRQGGTVVAATGFSAGGIDGVTVSGSSCTITAITGGIITAATCAP